LMVSKENELFKDLYGELPEFKQQEYDSFVSKKDSSHFYRQ
jgi:hypothetical protein